MKLNLGRIAVYLTLLNTHRVGNVGLVTLLAAVTLCGGQIAIDDALSAHTFVAEFVRGVYDAWVRYLAIPTIGAAGLAAYLGRPQTVPAKPKPP